MAAKTSAYIVNNDILNHGLISVENHEETVNGITSGRTFEYPLSSLCGSVIVRSVRTGASSAPDKDDVGDPTPVKTGVSDFDSHWSIRGPDGSIPLRAKYQLP